MHSVASSQCAMRIGNLRGPEGGASAAWNTAVSKLHTRKQLGTVVFLAPQYGSVLQSKAAENGAGNGHTAWEAWNKTYNSRTKEARRVCHAKLVDAKIESGQDPEDLCFRLRRVELIEEMGRTVHEELYEDISLLVLPAEYERVQAQATRRGILDW